MTQQMAKAKTYWVWTEKAQKENPKYSPAGVEIWPHYRLEAPAQWLEDGLIQDASEAKREGQMDIFDFC